MDKYTLYAAQFLPFHEHFNPKGHNACKGCGVALAVRHVYKALEGSTAHIEQAKWQIPWQESIIVKSGAIAAGSQPALLSIAKQDGALHICFDNECTDGKVDTALMLKRLPAVASASGCDYTATACPSHAFDLMDKIRKAWDCAGSAFVHILCPCPVAWGFEAENTVKIGRRAVESLVFPLYEIAQGYYKITCEDKNPQSVAAYAKAQQRFAGWNDKKIAALQEKIAESFAALKNKAQQTA
jgi:pyruvate/2-oxoacid:ferredoxin oxidoreductase beta subunit